MVKYVDAVAFIIQNNNKTIIFSHNHKTSTCLELQVAEFKNLMQLHI